MENMDEFPALLAIKPGKRMKNQLICLFHDHHFKLFLFREKLRNISDCRKVENQNNWNIFLANVFQETYSNASFNDVATVLTAMYLADCAQVFKDQVSALSESENALFRPIGKSLRAGVTLFQTNYMNSAYFHGIYKAVR